MARKSPRKPCTIELQATLMRVGSTTSVSKAEACEMFEASERTLRQWTEHGMPTSRGRGRQLAYPLPDAFTWVMAYRVLMARSRGGRAPAHLSLDQARTMDLESQYRQWPKDFLLVPLDWDHPAREEQLRKAAAGVAPPGEDELDEGVPA